jgi:predicted esterase
MLRAAMRLPHLKPQVRPDGNRKDHMDVNDLGFIHRFVAAPTEAAPAAGSPPTLLLLHGTGGSETDLLELGHSIAPGAMLLSPRGNVLENGMPRFFRRLAEGVFDREDLQRRTHELAAFVEAASTAYGFDSRRVIALGYSNGANIAASVLLLRPGVLSAAILLRPMVPLEPEKIPDLAGVPIFMAAGRFDPLVPPTNTERLAALFQAAGADVTLRWHNGGHALDREEIASAQAWFSSRMNAG